MSPGSEERAPGSRPSAGSKAPPAGYTWEYVVSGGTEPGPLPPPPVFPSLKARARRADRIEQVLVLVSIAVLLFAALASEVEVAKRSSVPRSPFSMTALSIEGWSGCYPQLGIASSGPTVVAGFLGRSSLNLSRSSDSGVQWVTLPSLVLPTLNTTVGFPLEWNSLAMSAQSSDFLAVVSSGMSVCAVAGPHSANPPTPPGLPQEVVAFVSEDAGISWNETVLLNRTVPSTFPGMAMNLYASVNGGSLGVLFEPPILPSNNSTSPEPLASFSVDGGKSWDGLQNVSRAVGVSNSTAFGLAPSGTQGFDVVVGRQDPTSFEYNQYFLATLAGSGNTTLVGEGPIAPLPSGSNPYSPISGVAAGPGTDTYALTEQGLMDLSAHGFPSVTLPNFLQPMMGSHDQVFLLPGSGPGIEVEELNATGVQCWNVTQGAPSATLSCSMRPGWGGPYDVPQVITPTSNGWVAGVLKGCFGGVAQSQCPPPAVVFYAYVPVA